MVVEDLILSNSDDPDYSVSSANNDPFDQIDRGEEDSPLQSIHDITDEWEHCRHIDDVTHLHVHKVPDRFDEKEMPGLYVAMLDLMERTQRCPDLNIFDKIMKWVFHFSKKFPGGWYTEIIASALLLFL